MRIFIWIGILTVFLAIYQVGKCSGNITTIDHTGYSGFGYELLLTKIEELEAKLQEQNAHALQQEMTAKQVSTLQRRLEETQSQLQRQEVATKQFATLQQRLEESQRQVQDQALLRQHVSDLQQRLGQTQAQLLASQRTLLQHQQAAEIGLRNQISTHNSGLIEDNNVYLSCKHAPKFTGVYQIRAGPYSFKGYCEQDDFGGSWLVIQRRSSGSENFGRSWADYRSGFGAIDDEFWLGLEKVHLLTKHQPHELLVEVTRTLWNQFEYTVWDAFQLGSESQGYRIVKLERCSGNSSCGLDEDEPFNTFDKDNSEHCPAATREFGWWYKTWCKESNLNAVIGTTCKTQMKWKRDSVKASRMMIRTKAGLDANFNIKYRVYN